MTVWGSAHWISSGLAILAVWGSDHLVDGPGGWALSGLLATTLYLLINSAQVAVARGRVTADERGYRQVTESLRRPSPDPSPGPARRTAGRG